MYASQINCIAQLFVTIIIFVANAQSDIDTEFAEDAGLIEEDLFAQTDHIVTLNSTNLDNIYESKYAWIVEFHANWCVHSQRFSREYKVFSESINNWKDIVQVGAYNCGTEENIIFCDAQQLANVPTQYYFSPYTKWNAIGRELNKTEIADVLRERVIQMLKIDQEKRVDISLPNLTQLRGLQRQNVFHGLSKSIKFYFIIFEEPNSYLGLTTILDFHSVPQILIRYVTSNNDKMCNEFNIYTFPTLIVIERDNIISNLMLPIPSRTAVYNRIKNFLKLKGLKINTTDVMDDSIILHNYLPKRDINFTAIRLTKDNTYQADLESALQYSLKKEIPVANKIRGEKMEALKNYLKVLVQYFPVKFDPPQYIENIYNAVKDRNLLKKKEFSNLITSLNKNLSHPNRTQWVGCLGSFSYTRRSPCGFWTLFHTLTVRHAIAVDKKNVATDEGGKVILAIHGYAKYFMQCTYCAEYYLYMAKKRNIHSVKTADEAVLWLWKIHNELNLKLVGDVNEDPEFPKIQYPAEVHCPNCRNADGTWNEVEVLKYLKEKYGSYIEYDLTK